MLLVLDNVFSLGLFFMGSIVGIVEVFLLLICVWLFVCLREFLFLYCRVVLFRGILYIILGIEILFFVWFLLFDNFFELVLLNVFLVIVCWFWDLILFWI